MNKRKLRRAKSRSHNGISFKELKEEMNMTKRAKTIISHAEKGDQSIDFIGNFIFLSTISGEAWMLDHRENLALRLADRYKPLQYRIIETDDRFHVEWTERFQIIDDVFWAVSNSKQSFFTDYPVQELKALINHLRQNSQ